MVANKLKITIKIVMLTLCFGYGVFFYILFYDDDLICKFDYNFYLLFIFFIMC